MAYVTKNREKSSRGNLKNVSVFVFVFVLVKNKACYYINFVKLTLKKEKKLFNSVRAKIPNFEETAL